jgi:hypothetical protein
VYIDDFIGAATASSPEQLNHIARALLHAIHDVFPEHLHTPDDQPASMKKILKGEGQWSPIKEILGWIFDGINKTVQLPPEKIDAILATMNAMLRSTTGVKFQDFQKLTGKLHHASIGIPTGKSLMTQFNRQLAREPKLVWMRRGSDLRNAMHLWAAMLRQHKMNPTKAKELVQGEPDYLIIVDASGSDGLGGVVLSEKSQVPATVFRHPWPEDIKQMLADNILTINDLELLAELWGWLILEALDVPLRHKQVAIIGDNKSAISWIDRWATRSDGPAGALLAVLAIRMRANQASPVVPMHLEGKLNILADIPSRSFGYKAEWHCRTHDELLTMFNSLFPLPNQSTWHYCQLTSKIAMRAIDALRTKALGRREWMRPPQIGTSISTPGPCFYTLSELIRIWTTSHTTKQCTTSQHLAAWFDKETWGEEIKSKLVQSVQRSQPLRRPSQWTTVQPPSTTPAETSTDQSS